MTFNICVIGCGHITRASHGPAYARYAAHNPAVALAACCDVDPQRAEETRAAFGFARAYSDWAAMLADEQPHAVCLNVPVQHTAALSARILELDIPLLAEKPPALTVEELDPLIALARRRGSLHQVAFNRRFAPLVVALKDWLAGHTVTHVAHTFTRVARRDPDFTTTAVHGIDTLRYLLGADYAGLRMAYPLLEREPAPVPAFVIEGSFTNGASAHLLFQPLAGAPSERTVIYTPGSTFELRLNHGEDRPGRLLHFEDGRLARAVDAAELCGGEDHDWLVSGFYAEDAAFFDVARAGRPSEHTFASARQSVAVMQALRERRETFRGGELAPADDR